MQHTTHRPLSCWEWAVTSAAVTKHPPKSMARLNLSGKAGAHGQTAASWRGRSCLLPQPEHDHLWRTSMGSWREHMPRKLPLKNEWKQKGDQLSPGQQAFVPSIQIISPTPIVQTIAIEMLSAYCIYRLLVPTAPLLWSSLRHPMPSATSSLPLSANAAGAWLLEHGVFVFRHIPFHNVTNCGSVNSDLISCDFTCRKVKSVLLYLYCCFIHHSLWIHQMLQ